MGVHTPQTRPGAASVCLLLCAAFLTSSTCAESTGDTDVDDMLCYMYKSAIAPTWQFQPLHDHVHTKASRIQYVDLRVIIPVYQRTFDFELLMSQWDRAIQETKLSVQVKVVEAGPTRLITDAMIRKPWLEYVYVPYLLAGGLFPKGMLYNVGFVQGARAKWTLFHDYEIAVPSNYLSLIEGMIKTNKKLLWAQPYYGKIVCYLDEKMSRAFRSACASNPGCHKEFIKFCKLRPGTQQGALGGSILVHSSAVRAVGGYDDDIFFGYSPEDQFFWDKLSALQAPVYQSDPSAVLFHLHHPPKHGITSIHFANMNVLANRFRSLSPDAKRVILTARKARFMASQSGGINRDTFSVLSEYCAIDLQSIHEGASVDII